MIASILATSLVAGLAVALPSEASDTRASNCYAKSKKANWWTVSNFAYSVSDTFATPTDRTSLGYINFSLTHPGINYTAECSARFTDAQSGNITDFIYGNTTSCNLPDNGDKATFKFSSSSGELEINHTWTCSDSTRRFKASGVGKLNCEESFEHNREWDDKTVYSNRQISCAHKTVHARVKEMHKFVPEKQGITVEIDGSGFIGDVIDYIAGKPEGKAPEWEEVQLE
ncbi:hypothetical protein DCS_03261 [Drechmeria coniospora]|uniref:AA1-like domain-containing protein n=1 Tax=Drechmeria coniospora TaxID=98403 RepID=A0A151GYE1_DRECN|nr:hypothetical protein DCS_03261 [Drechmeria coniospora]KAH8836241.1 hypothetical protein RJ55_10001 [Drechmeria coniospora]KYK62114.1 hypothetical protein DCS_03261 [Drechmeria coniospora]